MMIPAQTFGPTGHRSSRLIFGAAALSSMSQARADEVLATLAGHGINHIDTAAGYGDSEVRLAPFLAAHRTELFVATKTGDRSGPAARDSLERSLERMGIDHVDLVQLHNLVEEDEWLQAFGSGGAVEALFAARDEGLCRHVGVTGHGLRIARMHLRSIEQAPFASVLLPWNHSLAANDRYAADFEELASACTERGMAIQTIKAVARRRWIDDDSRPRYSWYEPIADPEVLERAVQFVLADPRLFLCTSSDTRVLPAIVAAARRHDGTSPPATVLAADRERHAITPLFDGQALEVL